MAYASFHPTPPFSCIGYHQHHFYFSGGFSRRLVPIAIGLDHEPQRTEGEFSE
jgi:hypothetical protein